MALTRQAVVVALAGALLSTPIDAGAVTIFSDAGAISAAIEGQVAAAALVLVLMHVTASGSRFGQSAFVLFAAAGVLWWISRTIRRERK